MRLGIIGAIGVDDIGDIVMLEAGLKQLKNVGRNKSTNIDFTIFALDKQKADNQIKKMNMNAKVTESLETKDLVLNSHENLHFSELLKIDLLSIINKSEFIFSFEECDALFFIGGGYFNGYWGNKLFPTFIIPIALGYQLKKPIFISGINIGPFSEEQINSLNGLFKKVDMLILRDRDRSIKMLKNLGGTEGKLILGADDILPVWYERNCNYDSTEIEKNLKYAVIQLHHWVEMYSKSYIEFYKVIAAFFSDILNKKFIDRIYFLPFTYFKGADYECGRRLKTFMNDMNKYIVLEPTDDHIYMRELISKSKFVIGSRYHPIIYGLGEQVPTLGIYVNDLYKQKMSGAYDSVEVKKEDNMIYINDISQKRLMKWYADIDKNYNNIQYKNKVNLINQYDFVRKSSMENFISKIKFR